MSSLFEYGLRRAVVLRPLARSRQHQPICAECGGAIADSKGSPHIPTDSLVDHRHDAIKGKRIPVYGWVCQRHSYNVVMPVSREDAFPEGWCSVPARFVDGQIRNVAVPQREVQQ